MAVLLIHVLEFEELLICRTMRCKNADLVVWTPLLVIGDTPRNV